MVSAVNGDFIFKGLPPGAYTVRFTLEGMQTVERGATIPLGGTARSDAAMEVMAASETVVVEGEAPSALETTTVGANFNARQVDALPINRTPNAIVELAGGVTDNTPNVGQVAISGGFAYDNVFMVNGVDITENLFGDFDNLFIEDAIAETQVLTSGVSAEYGRFSGGVINVDHQERRQPVLRVAARRPDQGRVARRDALREGPRPRARGRPQQDLPGDPRRSGRCATGSGSSSPASRKRPTTPWCWR